MLHPLDSAQGLNQYRATISNRFHNEVNSFLSWFEILPIKSSLFLRYRVNLNLKSMHRSQQCKKLFCTSFATQCYVNILLTNLKIKTGLNFMLCLDSDVEPNGLSLRLASQYGCQRNYIDWIIR